MDAMPSTPPLLPAAELRDIRVDLGETRAVAGVDLDVARRCRTVIVGANGSGKSTLVEVLSGARAPSSGSVRVHVPARAFVPQRTAVAERLPLTVRDVVSIGAWGRVGTVRRLGRDGRATVEEALDRVDMTALHRRPFSALSGGQRQRALIAQGLARGADLLILDEPTTALDDTSAALIRRAIADETFRGATVVCVSHDDRLIAEADTVVRMDAGRVADAGGAHTGCAGQSEKPRFPEAFTDVRGGE
jgi:zinc/manganese transport system ATP-binding protein